MELHLHKTIQKRAKELALLYWLHIPCFQLSRNEQRFLHKNIRFAKMIELATRREANCVDENHVGTQKSSQNKNQVQSLSGLATPALNSSAMPEKSDVFNCPGCNKISLHKHNCFSVHCRTKEKISSTYKSVTCNRCGLESSICPNAELAHPNSKHRLHWVLKTSEFTSEKVWEMECEVCVDLRLSRTQIRAQQQARGENVTELKKLTTKWTRCNHCFALYKKGRGKKGVHTRESCKLFHRPAAISARASQYSKYVAICEQLLASKIFHHLPVNLRKKVMAQCIGI